MAAFHGSSQTEGLGFNLSVAPADSFSPSISEDLLVRGQEGFQREKMVMILVDIRTEVWYRNGVVFILKGNMDE